MLRVTEMRASDVMAHSVEPRDRDNSVGILRNRGNRSRPSYRFYAALLVRELQSRRSMRRLRDLIIPFVALAAGCAGGGSHRLTVIIVGAGSVVGGVRSTPSGLDCALAAGPGGVSMKECSAEFADGELITLAFVPDGAGQVAQFFIERADSDKESCGASPAATPESCQLVLGADETVTVFPTSIPPP